jgi:uncharacterized SAM-binding protein YcdF (DUF218 family)
VRLVPPGKKGRVLLVVAALLVLLIAGSARLFVWPPTDSPRRADAVVALGGDPGQREAYKAIELVREGFAPLALVSLGGNPPAPCPAHPRALHVDCFRADPLDTRGEAEYVARMAALHHWRSLIVVPGRTQATRARLLFERCTTARLVVVPVSDSLSRVAYDVAYEWGALLKALVWKTSC